MRVALVQMDIRLGAPAENRAHAADLVRQAAAGADLVMLPEMWSTGYALPDLADNLADRDGEPTGRFLSALAAECGVYLAGSVADQRGGKVYNSATVYGPGGARLAEYSKVHLVPMMEEERYLTAGERAVVADLGGVKAGLAICYDLRFPELHRSMALAGAELLLIPAEWPVQRLHHWRTLLMARAIENQCYVLGCNRVGRDNANQFPGHSLVVDPWGEILAEGGEGESILYAEIDLGKVAEIRARVPVFRDRRPDCYRL
ncbi:MAG: carbon-nitrogen family hydrolase [Mycobacterium leprae]